MISKGEAIVRLRKMGVLVAEDQSIVTILLPKEISLKAGIKDIKEKLKSMDYEASFCIRQKKDISAKDAASKESENLAESDKNLDTADFQEEVIEEVTEGAIEETIEEITEEELRGSLLSMDDDGQFTLEGLGMDF